MCNDSSKATEKPLAHISQKENKRIRRNNHVLDYIRANAPISQFNLAKELGIPYRTLADVVKFLEVCDLIKTRIILNENNHAEKQIIIPEEVEDGQEKIL